MLDTARPHSSCPAREERACRRVSRRAGPAPAAGSSASRTTRQPGRIEDAARLLERATTQCPDRPRRGVGSPGVHVLRKNWRRAAAEAKKALSIDQRDEHAARILATSLYLEGDTSGALSAWNMRESPLSISLTSRDSSLDALRGGRSRADCHPRVRLTPDARRVRPLDSMPSDHGLQCELHAARRGGWPGSQPWHDRAPGVPDLPVAAGAVAARPAIDRELHVEVVSPTGGGERWQASWRWWEARPRIAAALEAPADSGRWRLSGADERESCGAGPEFTEERRRGVSFSAADWLTWRRCTGTPNSAPSDGHRPAVVSSVPCSINPGTIASPWVGTRRSLGIHDEHLDGGPLGIGALERAPKFVWLARAGLDAAGNDALRALERRRHEPRPRCAVACAPAFHDVIRDGVFGRIVASGGVEWRQWRWRAACRTSRTSRVRRRRPRVRCADVRRSSRSCRCVGVSPSGCSGSRRGRHRARVARRRGGSVSRVDAMTFSALVSSVLVEQAPT